MSSLGRDEKNIPFYLIGQHLKFLRNSQAADYDLKLCYSTRILFKRVTTSVHGQSDTYRRCADNTRIIFFMGKTLKKRDLPEIGAEFNKINK